MVDTRNPKPRFLLDVWLALPRRKRKPALLQMIKANKTKQPGVSNDKANRN